VLLRKAMVRPVSDSRVMHAPGLSEDLRVSPTPVIVALVVFGLVLGVLVQALSLPPKVLAFAVLSYTLAAVAWLLDRWQPLASRWFLVASAVVSALLANHWLGAAGSLALVAVPVALAAGLTGLLGAAAAALLETGLLVYLSGRLGPTLNPVELFMALAAIWSTLGVMVAAYQPIYLQSRWSWEHLQRAQRLLGEARDRQAQLRQALADLADANVQLTRLNHLAQGLRRAAEDARQVKEQFVANVSHELRTPLNMIIGFSEMIMEASGSYGNIPPALLADLAVIQRNSRHLASLIDDVLELSQIEAGTVALVKERVALSEILEAATIAVRPIFEAKGLYLEADEPDDLMLHCDRTRIREVLLNLLINAARFTEQGGVRVHTRQEGGDVIVSVADTGPGIAKEDQARLFQPFQQLDGSTRRRYGGTGLGLSISRNFVELHGGRMWVESDKGHGATFCFRLPKDPPLPLDAGAARWFIPGWEHVQRTHRSLAPAPVLRRRFVVLEGGRSLQQLLTRHLDSTEFVPVSSVQEAARELSRLPAQALLVNKPSVSEALEEITHAELPQGTPAIICSVPGTSEAADTLGASDYLVKPISRESLLQGLDRICPNGRTVLIVDDEPEAQRLFRRMLVSSGRGYRVLRAADGRRALSILREQHPDVMLLDLVMPGMDGFELLDVMRADASLPDIPVLIISARDPSGQPIVSSALAVARRGGLSMRELLRSVETLSDLLSPTAQAADQAPRATSVG
jgi:signal transduction histidine kinase/CheY-like chemotaxis protein